MEITYVNQKKITWVQVWVRDQIANRLCPRYRLICGINFGVQVCIPVVSGIGVEIALGSRDRLRKRTLNFERLSVGLWVDC